MTYMSWAAWIALAALFNGLCARRAAPRRLRFWRWALVAWVGILVAAAAACLAVALLAPGAVPPIR